MIFQNDLQFYTNLADCLSAQAEDTEQGQSLAGPLFLSDMLATQAAGRLEHGHQKEVLL